MKLEPESHCDNIKMIPKQKRLINIQSNNMLHHRGMLSQNIFLQLRLNDDDGIFDNNSDGKVA